MVFDDIDELPTDDRKTCAVVAKHLQRNWDAYQMARKAIGIKENHGEDMKSESKLVCMKREEDMLNRSGFGKNLK